MRLNWVLLPREPGSASFYGVFKQARSGPDPGGSQIASGTPTAHFLAGFAGVEAVA